MTLRSRQRLLRGLIGVALLLPSVYELLQVWEHWAGIDARLFWMVPLTGNVLLAIYHFWWLWRPKPYRR